MQSLPESELFMGQVGQVGLLGQVRLVGQVGLS